MTKPITIPKDLPKDSALSYDFLYEEGIKSIQQLAGNSWTDHNTHDPGITILEKLCYAISDLAYRIDYDITDLIGNDNISSYNGLFSPSRILTVNPVTILDLRKIIMDVKGVKNVWIEKVTTKNNVNSSNNHIHKGLYRVFIEKDDHVEEKSMLSSVKKELQAFRNVCEDFEEISVLTPQYIRLQGNIEIADNV
ncbi:MAG: hypothetical protein MI922_24410, partial [Bacteroidales bacterium]|nr:hypothetical protein [Bacteroidales bacterium]